MSQHTWHRPALTTPDTVPSVLPIGSAIELPEPVQSGFGVYGAGVYGLALPAHLQEIFMRVLGRQINLGIRMYV